MQAPQRAKPGVNDWIRAIFTLLVTFSVLGVWLVGLIEVWSRLF